MDSRDGYLVSEQKPRLTTFLLRWSNEYSACFKAAGNRDCISKSTEKSQTNSWSAVFKPEETAGQGGWEVGEGIIDVLIRTTEVYLEVNYFMWYCSVNKRFKNYYNDYSLF